MIYQLNFLNALNELNPEYMTYLLQLHFIAYVVCGGAKPSSTQSKYD